MTQPLIVLTTDFGLQDTYVGVMKGVISYYSPKCRIIDLTHHVRPQNILHGCYMLRVGFPYFPKNSIFLSVIDPGVGSERSAIAIKTADKILVLPNNGLCSLVLRDYDIQEAVYLTNNKYHLNEVSSTFHGRDIFSPVAAHLANGVPLRELGATVEPKDIKRLELVKNTLDANGTLETHVIHIDHFGNCITALHLDAIQPTPYSRKTVIGNTEIPMISKTYTDVANGEPLAYFGSDGFLEIAIRNGNAAETLGIEIDMPVKILA